MVLKWKWLYPELPEGEYFAVRYGIDKPNSETWTREREFTTKPSVRAEYVWEVAICRGDPSAKVCQQLAVSVRENFYGGDNGKCETPRPTVEPTPD